MFESLPSSQIQNLPCSFLQCMTDENPRRYILQKTDQIGYEIRVLGLQNFNRFSTILLDVSYLNLTDSLVFD